MEREFKAGWWQICSCVQCRDRSTCVTHGGGPLSTERYLSLAHKGHFSPTDALKLTAVAVGVKDTPKRK